MYAHPLPQLWEYISQKVSLGQPHCYKLVCSRPCNFQFSGTPSRLMMFYDFLCAVCTPDLISCFTAMYALVSRHQTCHERAWKLVLVSKNIGSPVFAYKPQAYNTDSSLFRSLIVLAYLGCWERDHEGWGIPGRFFGSPVIGMDRRQQGQPHNRIKLFQTPPTVQPHKGRVVLAARN